MMCDNDTILRFFANPDFRRQYLRVAMREFDSDINMFELASNDVTSYVGGGKGFLERYQGKRSALLDRVLPAYAVRSEVITVSPPA